MPSAAGVNTSGVVGPTAQRQVRPKIAQGAILKKYTTQRSGFDQAIVLNRQPMESV